MKIKILKASHVDWIKRPAGSIIDVDALTGTSLITAGLASAAAEDAPIETATEQEATETAEAPARGRGRRK
jgi:hypothetical protein